MKNTINVSNNVNLILNIYRCLFFQTATVVWKWKGSGICSTAKSQHR